jgi:AraC-like DNA-binding protein
VWWATAQLRRGRDPASYTAAARVRTHIEVLRAAGWTSTAIAQAAGISGATVSRIRKPSTRWCSRIVASTVLAVEP